MAMAAAIAAHQAELKQKADEEAKKKKKKGGAAAGGFHTFDSFDAKASQAIAHGKRPRQEAESSDSEPDEDEDKNIVRIPPVDWAAAPPELLPRKQIAEGKSPAKFVAHYIRFVVGDWRKTLANGQLHEKVVNCQLSEIQRAVYEKESSLKETEDMMAPLIQQLEQDAVDAEVMKYLERMVTNAAEREYKDAMNAYVELTVGKKKWNNAVMFGEAKHNKGFNARRVKRDEANKFDSDETVQKYVQGLRRLLIFSQLVRPNEDVSKHM